MIGRRMLALAGLVGPVWFLGGTLVFGARRAGYDPLVHAISRLGEQGSDNALTWNLAGFGVTGLLHLAFALALWRALGRDAKGAWMAGLMAVAGVAVLGAARFSCDPGCPAVSTTPDGWLHEVVGLTYFVALTALPLVGWRAFAAHPAWQWLSRPSLFVGLLLVALNIAGPLFFGQDHAGAAQRLFLIPAYGWQALVVIPLLRQGAVWAEPRDRAMLPA